MTVISKHVGDNLGGLAAVSWAFAKDLVDVIVVYGELELSIGQSVIDQYFTPIYLLGQKGSHSEPATIGAQGKVYTEQVSLRVSKDREDVRDMIALVGIRKVVLMVRDHQGLIKLVGLPEEGLRLKDDYQSGTKVTDHNGFNLQFSGQTTKKSRLVTVTA